ncbi:MAG TPA: hypothetical protein VIJ14_06280, partial [Rhabdochlamydiaceae bacterium]
GVAHLWLTVTPTHHLSAKLLDTTSKRFGQAALEGVQALDGNQALEYPVDSLRKTVSFKWVANHRGKFGTSIISNPNFLISPTFALATAEFCSTPGWFSKSSGFINDSRFTDTPNSPVLNLGAAFSKRRNLPAGGDLAA